MCARGSDEQHDGTRQTNWLGVFVVHLSNGRLVMGDVSAAGLGQAAAPGAVLYLLNR